MLENGWFRNDRHVQFTLGRFVDQQWKPIVMLRTPLKNFKWKKRLRKLLRKNEVLFEVKIQPFQPRPAIESLWQKFKKQKHGWSKVPSLHRHLFKGILPSAFNSYEVGVYHQDKLIAFSIFDKGEKSISSLEAGYDLDYGKHSLGIFTMLQEIAYGIEQGMAYYYPGFLPKNASMFNYKLRPGGTEFMRVRSKEWLPVEYINEADWLLEEVFHKLNDAAMKLRNMGVKTGIKALNRLSVPNQADSLANFNFLLVGELKKTNHICLFHIAWDPFDRKFHLFFERQLLEEGLPQHPPTGQISTPLRGTFDDVKDLLFDVNTLTR